MYTAVIKGIFLKYILLPLLVLLLAALLLSIKKKMPKIKTKILIVYVLLTALCLCMPGFLGFAGNMFAPYWYLFSMLLCLCLGTANVNMLQRYFRSPDQPLWRSILLESGITLAGMLLGAYLFYLIFNWISPYQGYAAMAATSLFIFAVPLSFYYCYVQFINIPFDIYYTWEPSAGTEAIDFEKVQYRSVLVLNLDLTKKVEDGKKASISAKAPSDGISFGDWFYRAVDDYNFKNPGATIHLYNAAHEPYTWIFYTKRSLLHLRKFIDFNQSVSQNRLNERSVIFCKRVIQQQ